MNGDEELDLDSLKEVSSDTFYAALQKAKSKNKFGAFVTLHETINYEKCKGKFLLYDNSAGVAVEQDGNIISVFSDGTHKGILKFLIAKAIETGGIKLDCFGSSGLKLLYSFRGFIPISKVKFEKKFAPKDWNYERDGQPDIIFWIYDIDRNSPFDEVVSKCDWDNIREFASYDEAKQYRDELLTEALHLRQL